ncbi:Carnitinyl-CoA dehydratase [Beauveria bassiana]|uniref:Carnitinyl-CoA dehydratase n=1 Tax=Beauveria bassiana TaxID=176275 RepID=A0A2N6NHF2_BEABA|nr:Carnitinyl-CoA dehydratase [Beauveria bassiana]
MATNTVIYEPTDEGVTTITINRPEVRNAVNHATSLKLAEAFQKFENDANQRVCIFTGAGTNFCAGYDLHEVAGNNNNSGELAVGPVDKVNGAFGPMGPSRMQLSKPVIAAISGHAVAGGLELSLLADLRVVDTTAVFGVFCRRFGVPLIDGGTVRLPRVVGQGRALDMILTGRPVDAQEALSFGLANRVVAKGQAVEAARELARSLVGFPQKCMRADLVSARYSVYDASSLEEALRFEFEKGISVVAEESVHGARRFDKGAGRGGKFDKAKL